MGNIKLKSIAGGSTTLASEDISTDEVVVIPSGGFLGYEQSWQDVAGDRVVATEYTNNTGKPISVKIITTTNGINNAALSVDAVIVDYYLSTASGDRYSLSAIVPAGSIYELGAVGHTIVLWSELR